MGACLSSSQGPAAPAPAPADPTPDAPAVPPATAASDTHSDGACSSAYASAMSTQPASLSGVSASSATPSGDILTESALAKLDTGGTSRVSPKGASSAADTGNTSVIRVEDLPEPVTPDARSSSASADPTAAVGGASLSAATPPPASEELPEVSLADIINNGTKRISRSRSRRASNNSMASLSAIPENLEITPLHARSERSDSARAGLPFDKSKMQLADVAELELESKATSVSRNSRGDRPDGAAEGSPRSSTSSLLSGDDSIMPHDYEYQMFMPVFPGPHAYRRHPNATEAIRGSLHHATSVGASPPPSLEPDSAPMPAAMSQLPVGGSPELSFSSRDAPEGADAFVATDDLGLQLLESVVQYEDERPDRELKAAELRVVPLEEQGEPEYHPVEQGTVQQETIKFRLPESVEGLRCVKKYSVGELSWTQTCVLGDRDAGEHIYQFEESQVPRGALFLGDYTMKTVFMDAHGSYLWAGISYYRVVRKQTE